MRYQKDGFSLIELIIVVAISAILMGIAGYNFAKQRQKGDLTRATQSLGQDIRVARSKALSQSTTWRIRSISNKQYILEEWDRNINNWAIRRQRGLPGKAKFKAESISGSIAFDSRGFANIDPPDLQIRITNDIKTQEIITSMTGSLVIMDNDDN